MPLDFFFPFGPSSSSSYPLGSITELICTASDTFFSFDGPVVDGVSGDLDFPHGPIKALVTVGEIYDEGNKAVTGVPDGMGAYLLDDDTIRVIVQGESYGPMLFGQETYSYSVNNGEATFTGSHVHYADINRTMLPNFIDGTFPASEMIVGFGELIENVINLAGVPVGPRSKTTQDPTTSGAHYSNTDAAGNYILSMEPSEADWVMFSLCSAYLAQTHTWGEGIGTEDSLFMTNEEILSVSDGASAFVGASAYAIHIQTKTAYALGAMSQGGYEKIVEIRSGHPDYVVFALTGYNGAFGSYDPVIEARNTQYGPRLDGTPWVQPEDIVPYRIYIGKKFVMEDGTTPGNDFLARNGLRYGQIYGMAVDMNPDDNESVGGLWRDDFHRDVTRAYNGAKVSIKFLPIQWRWDGVVRDFVHDASWEFQESPPNYHNTTWRFWNAAGNDSSGCKTEHNSHDPRPGKFAFVQSSTCGYFGHVYLTDLDVLLSSLTGNNLPTDIDGNYYVYQGQFDVRSQIRLGGKGQYRFFGFDAATSYSEFFSITGSFEDTDGFEIMYSGDNLYAVIQEDSFNTFGERMFISSPLEHENDGNDISYYFVAMSGGGWSRRTTNLVGIPADTATFSVIPSSAHEFSGSVDLSPFLAQNNGMFLLSPMDKGYKKLEIANTVPLNSKLILLGLQAHNLMDGIIAENGCDRGGQWLLYNPSI